MVQAQLHLIPVDKPWQLDDSTCRIGRAGLAMARAALSAANRSTPAPTEQTDDHTLAA